jgi:hypothetical protein
MAACPCTLTENVLVANWDQQAVSQVGILGDPSSSTIHQLSFAAVRDSRIAAAHKFKAAIEVKLLHDYTRVDPNDHGPAAKALRGMTLQLFPRPDRCS